jgi:hypothetical protein
MHFDFKNVFQRIGRNIVAELKDKMRQQVGVDGRKYDALAPSTLKSKARRRDIPSSNKTKRMLATNDFVNNAYLHEPLKDGLRVFVSSAEHGRDLKMMQKTLRKYKESGKRAMASKQSVKVAHKMMKSPTYKQITEWQIETDKATFFPQTDAEVFNLKAVEKGRIDFENESLKQMLEGMKMNITELVHLG